MRESIIAVGLLVACAATAAAQTSPDRPRRQAGAAMEWSSVTETLGGAAEWRLWRGSFGIEVAGSHSAGEFGRDHIGTRGTAIGETTTRSVTALAASVVGRVGRGRLRAAAGIGPALFSFRSRTRTTFDGVLASDTINTDRTLGLRIVADAEVDLTVRVAGFAGVRVDLHGPPSGTGGGALAAGVRIAF